MEYKPLSQAQLDALALLFGLLSLIMASPVEGQQTPIAHAQTYEIPFTIKHGAVVIGSKVNGHYAALIADPPSSCRVG